MQYTLPKLKIGDIVVASVVENTSDGFVIANFDGDLLSIKNKTGRSFEHGQNVFLEIIKVAPLGFRLKGPSRGGSLRLDVKV